MLEEHFRVFIPDTPGYGGSDVGEQEWGIPDYGRTLLDGVRKVVGNDPFLVGGCHTGASIALEVAAQSGGQAQGLALMGLPAYDDETRAEKLAHWAPNVSVQEDGSHLSLMWNRYSRIWNQPPLAAKNRAVLDVLGALEHYNWGYNAAFRYDPVPTLLSLEIPVMFITAEFDALADADRRCAELIGAVLVQIDGISGQIGIREPQRLTRELLAFAKVAARR